MKRSTENSKTIIQNIWINRRHEKRNAAWRFASCFDRGKEELTQKERLRIRGLAEQLREEAAFAKQRQRVVRYKRINALQIEKPPVALHPPQQALRDLFPDNELIISDPYFRSLEYDFLMQLSRARTWKCDMPVTDTLYTGLFFQVTDWMPGHKSVRINQDLTSTAFEPCIRQKRDLEKLEQPRLIVNHQATEERFERVSDILGDILDLHKGTPFGMTCGWGESMIDELAEMRGLEQLYLDMIDCPEFVHQAMERLTEGKLDLLRQYMDEGVLSLNNGNQLIGSCSYPFTDELPGMDYTPGRITPKNLWGFAQAQELSGVSKEMLEEFVLPYQTRIIQQFGLCSYGCCEAMDVKIDSVAKYIPNLRILSISPFTDIELAAEKCRGKFVMACKLHPEQLVDFDPLRLERYIRRLLELTQGCCITLNFAELFYYDGHPRTFIDALETVSRAVEKYWKH